MLKNVSFIVQANQGCLFIEMEMTYTSQAMVEGSNLKTEGRKDIIVNNYK